MYLKYISGRLNIINKSSFNLLFLFSFVLPPVVTFEMCWQFLWSITHMIGTYPRWHSRQVLVSMVTRSVVALALTIILLGNAKSLLGLFREVTLAVDKYSRTATMKASPISEYHEGRTKPRATNQGHILTTQKPDDIGPAPHHKIPTVHDHSWYMSVVLVGIHACRNSSSTLEFF